MSRYLEYCRRPMTASRKLAIESDCIFAWASRSITAKTALSSACPTVQWRFRTESTAKVRTRRTKSSPSTSSGSQFPAHSTGSPAGWMEPGNTVCPSARSSTNSESLALCRPIGSRITKLEDTSERYNQCDRNFEARPNTAVAGSSNGANCRASADSRSTSTSPCEG